MRPVQTPGMPEIIMGSLKRCMHRTEEAPGRYSPEKRDNRRSAGAIRPAFSLLCLLLLLPILTGCGRDKAKDENAGRYSTVMIDPSAEGYQYAPSAEEESGAEEQGEEAEETVDNRTPGERLADDIAAGAISWENAPVIGDRDALMAYLRRVRDAGLTEAPVIYTNGFMADYEEILKAVNLAYIDFDIRSKDEDGESYHVLYTLTYYPGERVADAYLSGSTEGLTQEELALYSEASFLVEEAKKLPNELLRELFLHDQVIGRATYHNRRERVGVPRFCTAIGAMLDGQANCQGYTDAFQMLATMAGLTVGKQSGYAGDEEHIWNTVCLDGRWYALDCTWDDASYTLNGTEYTSYTYFNAPAEVLAATHSFDDYTVEHEIVEKLSDAPDYFYLTDKATDSYFGYYYPSMEKLINDAAARLDRGVRYFYAMSPADTGNYRRYTDVTKGIDRQLRSGVDYVTILTNRGDFSFVTIDATGNEIDEGEEETQSAGTWSSAGEEDAESGAAEQRIAEDGVYTSAEDVALYLHLYGKLPQNFMTKKEARELGWNSGGLDRYAPGMCIGGDSFGNYEGLLPEGKRYHECDIDTLGASERGAKRIVYDDDGNIYYTEDHYETFTKLY